MAPGDQPAGIVARPIVDNGMLANQRRHFAVPRREPAVHCRMQSLLVHKSLQHRTAEST